MLRSRPCPICHRWFRVDARLGDRQRVCSFEACQQERQRRNVAAWLHSHPDDAVRRHIRRRELRAAKGHPVDPLKMPVPLDRLPWDVAQKSFGVQGADFIGHLGRLLGPEPKKSMPS